MPLHERVVRSNTSTLPSQSSSVHQQLLNLSADLGHVCNALGHCYPRKGERLRFTGSVADKPYQLHAYFSLVAAFAQSKSALGQQTVVCESGFNAGHSALLVLLAHSSVKYVGWELGDPYRWETTKDGSPSNRTSRYTWASRTAEGHALVNASADLRANRRYE
jgi:hypothetical protein